VRLPPFEFRSTLAPTPHPAADDAAMIPDFFVKRVGLELWDVLDIKTADARVVVGGKSRRHFSSAVAEATAQLREYSRRLRTPQIKQYLFERYQMTVSEPVAMVIVGRDFCFSSQVEKDPVSRTGRRQGLHLRRSVPPRQAACSVNGRACR
jgi:hypothetical protein